MSALAPGQFFLTGELCIFNASELKQKLRSFAEVGATYTLDLGEVSELDTAGLQLLLMAKREATQDGWNLSYVNHSEPVLETIRLLGLGVELDDPFAAPRAGSAQ